VFEQLRRKGKHVFLYAFDLLELDGQDLRRDPLETRNGTLASLAAWEPSGGIRDQGRVGMQKDRSRHEKKVEQMRRYSSVSA